VSNELSRHIEAVESALGDPARGLPEEVFLFASRITPLLNVDLLIRDESSRTLLSWRDDEFYGTGWHIPGGIIRYKESWADRIRVCAGTELGAEVSVQPTPILVSEHIRSRPTRGHFVSLLFECRLRTPPDPSREARDGLPVRGHWRWHDHCPSDLIEAQHFYAPFLG
jgi:colanic acid biosynthesis protein WcaH